MPRLENGNSKALKQLKAEVPNLKESTVRSFKQAYERKLKEVRKKRNVEAQVLAIPSDTRGRQPILNEELAYLTLKLLEKIRSRFFQAPKVLFIALKIGSFCRKAKTILLEGCD